MSFKSFAEILNDELCTHGEESCKHDNRSAGHDRGDGNSNRNGNGRRNGDSQFRRLGEFESQRVYSKTAAFLFESAELQQIQLRKSAHAAAQRAYGPPPQFDVIYEWSMVAIVAMQALSQLGFECNCNGSAEDLKRVHRKAVKRVHPDVLERQIGAEAAHRQFLKVQSLFDVCLRNPPRRRIERR